MAKSLSDFVADARSRVPEIDVTESLEGWTVLDVREPDEYDSGRIPGAVTIPRGFLEVKADHDHAKRDERLQDRSQRIVCVCAGGNRSLLAADTLLQMGFSEVVSLRGGMTAWQEAGMPVEK